eukprot:jgi/Bigna1/86483/estExt_fgenesh1_pg.C_110008
MKSSRKSLRKRSKRKRDNDHPHDNEHSKDFRAPSNLPHRRKKQIRKQDGINSPSWEESKQEVPKVIFVVAGSAGGRPPKAIKSLLEGLGMTIYVPNSGKWKSYKTEGQNREFLLEGIKEAMKIAKKEKEAHNIVIASSSFGCRVAASLWVADKAEGVVPKIVMRKLICFGYPLFRPKPGQDRIRVLKDLPENLQTPTLLKQIDRKYDSSVCARMKMA